MPFEITQSKLINALNQLLPSPTSAATDFFEDVGNKVLENPVSENEKLRYRSS